MVFTKLSLLHLNMFEWSRVKDELIYQTVGKRGSEGSNPHYGLFPADKDHPADKNHLLRCLAMYCRVLHWQKGCMFLPGKDPGSP
jgi:hypothetical protein